MRWRVILQQGNPHWRPNFDPLLRQNLWVPCEIPLWCFENISFPLFSNSWIPFSGWLTHCLNPIGLLLQKYLSWIVYKQKKFISHRSGRWKSQIRMRACSRSDKSPPLHYSLVIIASHGGKARGLLRVPFTSILIPFMRVPFPRPTYLLKSSHWRLGFPKYEFWGEHKYLAHCTHGCHRNYCSYMKQVFAVPKERRGKG